MFIWPGKGALAKYCTRSIDMNYESPQNKAKQKRHYTGIICLCAVLVICFIAICVYLLYPTCMACGKKTRDTMRVGNMDVPWCKEHQEGSGSKTTLPVLTNSPTSKKVESTHSQTDNTLKTNQGTNQVSGNVVERPYYGMSERLINSTKIGSYSYKENSTITPEGNGSSYSFIIDSRHAMLVKTASGIVVLVQYIEDGKKVLWSESSSGFHDLTRR